MVVKCSPDLPLASPCSANLLRGIAGIHFVEHIADRGNHFRRVCCPRRHSDDEMNAKLREIHRYTFPLEIIAPEAAHVLYDDALDPLLP